MKTAFAPTPLASYLSALGLLRVLGAQLDQQTRGFWKDGRFHLVTSATIQEISTFLAEQYQPSPCLTPWNKDSGFLSGQPPAEFSQLQGQRFTELRRIAAAAAPIVARYARSGRIDKTEKALLMEDLSRSIGHDGWSSWLRLCAVPFQDAKGTLDIRHPALLGGTGGAFGRADFGAKFIQALLHAKADHFAAAILGTPDPGLLISKGDSMIYAPASRGDGQQGYGVATQDTSSAKANPADLLLLAEGMGLFEGYATTAHPEAGGRGSHQQASFSLAVLHNVSGHPSSSWLENEGKQTEELWCPLWDEACSFTDVRQALARVALMPLPRQLQSGTDFALYASQLGRSHGLSGFARYCFPARIGKGTKMPSLIELFPLRDDQEDRSDALAGVVRFCSSLRGRAKDPATPSSYRHAAERVVAEADALAGGGGSFAELLRRLVSWRRQEQIQGKGQQLQRFRDGRPELPPQWFSLLQRELDGPEWRLALALGVRRPYASMADVLLLLENRIDAELVEDLSSGIGWIERRGLPPLPAPDRQIPWLPPDYLAAVLLNQTRFQPQVPIEGTRARWRELLLAHRAEEAMAVALQRLRSAELVSWPWPAITHSDPQQLLWAVQVPLHPATLQALRRS